MNQEESKIIEWCNECNVRVPLIPMVLIKAATLYPFHSREASLLRNHAEIDLLKELTPRGVSFPELYKSRLSEKVYSDVYSRFLVAKTLKDHSKSLESLAECNDDMRIAFHATKVLEYANAIVAETEMKKHKT